MTEPASPEPRCTPPLPTWPALAAGQAVWTGHQPRFWHPGILAKYRAADTALAAAGDTTTPLHHVVVDQDVQDPLAIDLPVLQGDVLSAARVRLGPVRPQVPTGAQPPATINLPPLPRGTDPRAAAGLHRIAAALQAHTQQPTLALQTTHALHDLLAPQLQRPLCAHQASAFAQQPWFYDETHSLLHDAQRCVGHYNRAVAQHPRAGITALQREPFRVELPLWHLPWNAPRQRVYADLADTQPLLTVEDGQPITDPTRLAPRALLMTAWLRRPGGVTPACGLFVHGTGGGQYDRITDAWWHAWRGEALAPVAVATADQRLSFDAPVHHATDVHRAVWHAHHLPHNPERILSLTGPLAADLIAEKAGLLEHMHDDRDRKRRRAAFHRIHAINAQLLALQPDALHDAHAQVARTRQGVANATLAHRRDWPFVFFN